MVRLQDARKRFHQGGLACPVLAQERVDLPCTEVKAHIGQCMHASESLGQALDEQQFGGLIKVGRAQCSLSSEVRTPRGPKTPAPTPERGPCR